MFGPSSHSAKGCLQCSSSLTFVQQSLLHVVCNCMNTESSVYIGGWKEINDVEMKNWVDVLIFIVIYKVSEHITAFMEPRTWLSFNKITSRRSFQSVVHLLTHEQGEPALVSRNLLDTGCASTASPPPPQIPYLQVRPSLKSICNPIISTRSTLSRSRQVPAKSDNNLPLPACSFPAEVQ